MRSTLERRQEIIQLAQVNGKVDVGELAKQFDVSTVTIRHDLNDLSKTGLLVRCRGGALVSTRLTRELSVKEKYEKHLPIKQQLGRAAAALVKDCDSIILDSGTTTEEIAHCLAEHNDLVVMTNGLNIASVLADAEHIEVLLTGGTLRKKSMSLFGRQAEKSLTHMHFNKVFLGADGVDSKAGISTYFEAEANLNRLMCDVSSEIIVVADSSKFDRRGFHVIRTLAEITTLVTDSGIPENYVHELEQSNVKVCIIDV